MKAIQIVAPERVELVDLPGAEPGEGEVLVEVETVATCPHWDTSLNRPEDTLAKVPDNQSFKAASTLELARRVSSHARAAGWKSDPSRRAR